MKAQIGKTGGNAQRILGSAFLLLAAFFFGTCSVWGERDNPADSGAVNYEGAPTVASLAEFRTVAPPDGGELDGRTVAVTKVLGAAAYEMILASTAAGLDLATPASSAGNLIDLGLAGIVNGSTYWWKARPQAADGTWGAWSQAASFTVAWTIPAATPVFDPTETSLTGDTGIVISCGTGGATVYYTTNGSTPTTGSTPYTGAISVTGDGTVETIKAMAVAVGFKDSAVASAKYSIAYASAAAPTFSRSAGTYLGEEDVTIHCATAGAKSYYTVSTSGIPADPTTDSMPFADPIPLVTMGTMTIKAISTAPGFAQSLVSTAVYPPALLTMLPVTGGTFDNGTAGVSVSAFTMSECEVTQAEYAVVTGDNPGFFAGDTNRPVEMVTWYDAVEFCNSLSQREGLGAVYQVGGRTPAAGYPITSATVTMDMASNGYRLPTEAEWEFAARGGEYSHNYTYAGSSAIDDVGWYSANAGSAPNAVGGKLPNELGLHDLSGNVWEWCWDSYGSYPGQDQVDPTGAATASGRSIRGGSWYGNASYCASSCRFDLDPGTRHDNVGFRVVRRH